MSSTWEYIRLKGQKMENYENMWTKGLPVNIFFFMWRFWKYKLPLDDVLKRMRYNMVSRCWCCSNPKEDTFQYLFTTYFSTNRTWSYFCSLAGININGLQLQQIIMKW